MVRVPSREVAGREIGVVDQRRIGVDALLRGIRERFGRRINLVEQGLPRGVDGREIALERRRNDGGVAGLVIPFDGRR